MRRRGATQTRLACVMLLVVPVALAVSCASKHQQASADSGSDSALVSGKDWELTETNVQNWSYIDYDVYCSVTLLRDRMYGDSELTSAAKKVVQYVLSQKRQVPVTGVRVHFFAPGGTPAAVYGLSAIAEVYWGTDQSGVQNQATFRYSVTYNYARNQKAGEASIFGPGPYK